MIYDSSKIAEIKPTITTEYILSKVTEYDVYRYYIGSDLKIGRIMNSPLRKDKNPSFGIFKATNGNLLFKDQSTGDSGNCIQFVSKLQNITYREAEKQVYKDIIENRFTISTYGINVQESFEDTKLISVKSKNFTITDDEYWSKYGISRSTLKLFNVFPISHYWINDILSRDTYTKQSPMYAYQIYLKFKIYKPLSSNKKYKWVGNVGNYDIQGYEQLPLTGDLLIITKSLKDVMVLYEMGYTAIAPQGEGHMIPKRIIDNLKYRFKKIIILYDNDNAGIIAANKLSTKYEIPSIIIPTDYEVKDISDFVYYKSFEEAHKWIKILTTPMKLD